MGLVSKSFTFVCAGAGLAAFSQLPEFAQQYRQRLGGAVEELQVVVSDFDKDALSSGLNRDEALDQMANSVDAFPRDRGQSMERTINRYERLSVQQQRMEDAEPVSRPVFLFSTYDEKLLMGSWDAFEPAVPLNAPGAVWGGFGAFLLGFLARLPIGFMGWMRKMRKRRKDMGGEVVGGIKIDPQAEAPLNSNLSEIGLAPQAVAGHQSVVGSGSKTLLDQIVLEERVVGEVNASGHIVRKR